MSKWEKVKFLTSTVCDLIKSDVKYSLCFIAWMSCSLISILYSIYLMMWITEFIHTGVLEDDKAAKTIYKNTMTVAMISCAILLPAIGYVIDYIPGRIVCPIAFLSRGILVSQFSIVKDPRSMYCQFLIISVVLTSTF